MPTIYPKHSFMPLEAVDVDYVNENFQEVVSAIQGNLGEHNWRGDSFNSSTTEKQALGRIHTRYYESARLFDKTSGETRNDYIPLAAYSGGERWTKIPVDRRWFTVIDLEITTRDCMLWLIASWQQDYQSPAERDPDFPGVQYCLAIDGTRIAESTIGGMDRANDKRGEANAVWKHPFVTDAFIKLSSGTHTVALQARMVPTFDYKAYNSNFRYYVVATRELIAMEIT